MNKKIFIFAGITLVVLIIFFINIKNDKELNDIANNSKVNVGIISNTVYNEKDGKNEIHVYNKETGRKITVLDESEEYKLKIYEMDPDYEEFEVFDSEESIITDEYENNLENEINE